MLITFAVVSVIVIVAPFAIGYAIEQLALKGE